MTPTPGEMPPITKYPRYCYRVFANWLSFLIFGIATLLLALTILPLMTLFLHPHERFKKAACHFISSSFHGYTMLMNILGVAKLEVDDRAAFRALSAKIVVANHPSLLDVVMLISLIPNANCVVNSGLMNNIIVRGVIRRLYILNSLNFEELTDACIQSMNQGYCVIIFPEGTRTPRGGEMKLKKGAARLSLVSGRGIVPLHIGGTDKWGLGKHNPWLAYNHTEKYVYRIRMREELSPDAYAGLENSRAVRRLTEAIRAALSAPPEE
jgi:1-acyl-sn-glycerol-3-phosphate acyltransferase